MIESNKLSMWVEGELKIMDETWLQDLNERNHAMEGEDSTKWDFAYVPRENFFGRADYLWMTWECWTCLPTFKKARKVN